MELHRLPLTWRSAEEVGIKAYLDGGLVFLLQEHKDWLMIGESNGLTARLFPNSNPHGELVMSPRSYDPLESLNDVFVGQDKFDPDGMRITRIVALVEVVKLSDQD